MYSCDLEIPVPLLTQIQEFEKDTARSMRVICVEHISATYEVYTKTAHCHDSDEACDLDYTSPNSRELSLLRIF